MRSSGGTPWEGFSYITGITKPQMEKLLREGHLQLGLFDNDLTEVRLGDVRYVCDTTKHGGVHMKEYDIHLCQKTCPESLTGGRS